MASHTVVFGDDPPAFLNVAPLIARLVTVFGREDGIDAAEQERSQRGDVIRCDVRLGHFQSGFGAVVIKHGRILELGQEKTALVIPRFTALLRGSTVRLDDGAALRNFGQPAEVEAIDGLAAFGGELGADAPFLFEAGNLVAAGAAIIFHERLALGHEAGIVHERRGSVTRVRMLERDEIAGDISSVFRAQPQIRHHRRLMDLELVTVIRAARVVEIENEWQAALGVVLRPQVALLVWAVGTRALAGVVHPAHKILVLVFLADAGKVRGKFRADRVRSFAHRVAPEAPARLEKLLAVSGIARRLGGQGWPSERRLPDERGNGLGFILR